MEPKTSNVRPSANGLSKAEITRAFERQRAFQRATRPSSAEERIEKIKRLRQAILDRRDAFREALYADFCKPPEEVDLTEIYVVTVEAQHTASHLKKWMQPETASAPWALLGTRSEVHYEPKGVVLIISPWNYPVTLTLGPLISALAAGNSAILKPSEYTSHTAHVMKELVEGTFDEREVALFEGNKDVAQALLKKPFDHIFFTGSPRVGKLVMKAAAEHLTPVTLELGGKSPVVVDETADVESAARKIVWGKFMNAGQTCLAPDYVLAHEDVHAALVYALRRQIHRFYGETDEARRASPDYARLVDAGHFERVERLLEDAIDRGAYVAEGGATDAKTRYIAPTLLSEVPADADIMKEEIFGPILPVLPFGTLEEAVGRINEKPNPLALYVFSRSDAHTDLVLRRTTAGGTCVNDTLLHFFNPSLPYGGTGYSGIGRAHGQSGFKAFSNERAVLRRSYGSAVLEWLYPPYGSTARQAIDGLLKWL